jgi:ribosomal protein S18 acetylase RimI-like enzyme
MGALATYQGYQIGRAILFDVRRLCRFERLVFAQDAYTFLEMSLLLLLPHTRNYKLLASDGDLVGFISGSLGMAGKPGWIITLGVAPAHQRQGLGRFLLRWCEAQLKAGRIRLTVRAGNAAAIRLYEQTGYVVVKRRPHYYLDGETGLEMEKRFQR